jgi:hypothetical protein
VEGRALTRADWQAATPKCPGCPTNIGQGTCGLALEWTTVPSPGAGWAVALADREGIWECLQHGPMLTGYEAAERAGWAPMRFAAEAS